jgi:DNA repair exonuclease SbcCD ATPase subunit
MESLEAQDNGISITQRRLEELNTMNGDDVKELYRRLDKMEEKVDKMYLAILGDGLDGGLVTRIITTEGEIGRLRNERNELSERLGRTHERLEQKERHEIEMKRDIEELHERAVKAEADRKETQKRVEITEDVLNKWRNRAIGVGIGLTIGAGSIGGAVGAIINGLMQ